MIKIIIFMLLHSQMSFAQAEGPWHPVSQNNDEIQWQDSGVCIQTELRVYDDSANFYENLQAVGHMNAGIGYYSYEVVTVSSKGPTTLKLKGSMEYNETMLLNVNLPDERSLAGMSISVKANQTKIPHNTDLYTKSDEFFHDFIEQFIDPKYPELTSSNIHQFDRRMRLHSLFPSQSELLNLKGRITMAIQRKKRFYAQSLTVYNNKFSDIQSASFSDLIGKYARTLLGASVTCYFEDNVRKRASPQGNIHKWTSC